MGEEDTLQRTILCMGPELQEYLEAKEKVAAIVKDRDDIGLRFPNDFGADVENMTGVTWTARGGCIVEVTLGEALSTSMYKRMSLWLVGRSEDGKSSLGRGPREEVLYQGQAAELCAEQWPRPAWPPHALRRDQANGRLLLPRLHDDHEPGRGAER